ncbi:metal ABC transporter substrate-binding protein [Streptomyces buecherae]|uniref:Zinc ABC transporter substrate-binding protein n=1 Tax=Streptomyces buecherae TaxID=2763006 RepID=A0A7H8N5W7_9ACTN|nr:metal ABC transporter substrate-binding protein [Streptomyces buecherae]QKW49781.1 zinc ABC transporter substrate-binding protein [Streptomyces buecherae]
MNVRRRLLTGTAIAGATALSLGTLSACSGASDKDGKPQVVASFYPMEFLAKQIIGDADVRVDTLTKPGVEPHDLELKPRQVGDLSKADVVVYLKGLQPAVDEAVGQSEAKHKVDAATLTSLEKHGASERGHEHEGHDHAEGEHEGGHEHEGEHDHGGEAGGDPHVWLDPTKYAEVAKGLNKKLAEAYPDHKADFQKNTDALVTKLTALDKEFTAGLKNRTTDTFITTHAAFGYLAERYGLDQEGISGVSPEAEASPARIKEIQEIAKKEKVSTVFFETLASNKGAKTVAEDTGLKTGVLDPIEGINDKSKGDDYFEVMRANLAALKQALGAR